MCYNKTNRGGNMSKYLIKILSICAFVVLLPLIITATALTVTETRAFSLSVDISGNTNERYSASVLINDKEENKFTSIKNTNVELTFVADAYDFIGWFKGSKNTFKEDDAPISKENKFTYNLTENSYLTAVCKEKVFTVKYKGTDYEGNTLVIDDQTLNYGAELVFSDNSDFAGWKIVGDASNKIYKNAEFANYAGGTEIEVEAVWISSIKFKPVIVESLQGKTEDGKLETFDFNNKITTIKFYENATEADFVANINDSIYNTFFGKYTNIVDNNGNNYQINQMVIRTGTSEVLTTIVDPNEFTYQNLENLVKSEFGADAVKEYFNGKISIEFNFVRV